MTDLEIARIVRQGRRQGFGQACLVAFFAALVASPLLALTDSPVAAAAGVSVAILAALGVAGVLTNSDSD